MPYVTELCKYDIDMFNNSVAIYDSKWLIFFNHSNIKESEAPEALIRRRNVASRFVVNANNKLVCYSKSVPKYYLSM